MTHETETVLLSFVIPGEAPSTLNLREHWAAKNNKARAIRAKVRLLAPRWLGPAPICVRLTRAGFRQLDGDNLQGALKAHRDAVAAYLRVDDGSPMLEWQYAQETNGNPENHGVHVEVFNRSMLIIERVELPEVVPPTG